MANPDLSAIATSFVERGGPIFAKRVLNWQLRKQGVQVRTNVKTPQALTKLSAVGGPRPYRAVDDIAGNGVKFTDRTLTVYNSKWDYDFDPEEFRNTYLANDPQVPFAQAAAEQLAKEYLAGIQTSTLYLGVRNAAGTGAVDICDGWGTIIAAAIVATTLTAIATGVITNANAVTKFEQVAAALPTWMRENGFIIYCSYANFDNYRQHYRATYGFSFEKSVEGDYKLDNINGIIRPVGWMNSSARLIATVENNLVFGTDIENVQVAASVRRNIIEARPMMAAGTQIQDLAAIFVNDQA